MQVFRVLLLLSLAVLRAEASCAPYGYYTWIDPAHSTQEGSISFAYYTDNTECGSQIEIPGRVTCNSGGYWGPYEDPNTGQIDLFCEPNVNVVNCGQPRAIAQSNGLESDAENAAIELFWHDPPREYHPLCPANYQQNPATHEYVRCDWIPFAPDGSSGGGYVDLVFYPATETNTLLTCQPIPVVVPSSTANNVVAPSSTGPAPAPFVPMLPDLSACSNFAIHTLAIDFGTSSASISGTNPGLLGANSINPTGYTRTNPSASCFIAAQTSLNAVFAHDCSSSFAVRTNAPATRGPGLYCRTGDSLVFSRGTHTLDAQGNSSAIFIFRSDLSIAMEGGATFNLINGAQASRVFFYTPDWIILGNSVTVYTSTMVGTFVSGATIDASHSTVNGQLLTTSVGGAQSVIIQGSEGLSLSFNSTAPLPPIPSSTASVLSSSTGSMESSSTSQGQPSSTGVVADPVDSSSSTEILSSAAVTAVASSSGSVEDSSTARNEGVVDPILPDGSLLYPFTVIAESATSFDQTLVLPVIVKDLYAGSSGNFSVFISVLAATRNTSLLLQGRQLSSDIITFSFTPSNTSAGLQSATIAFNITGITVADGYYLQWYKFNVTADRWDLMGGTLNTTTQYLEYTTTSFSDWSVQQTALPPPPPPTHSRDWWDPSMPYMPLWAWLLVSLATLMLFGCYLRECGCFNCMSAKVQGYSKSKV